MLKFVTAAALVLTAGAANAAMSTSAMAEAPAFVRGTVKSFAAPALTVTARDGHEVTVFLSPDAQVASTNVIGLDAIKPTSYIGTTAEPDAKGQLTALEVHVFPEALRGTGDGHRPWDLTPKSTMTNGNVSTVAGGAGGVKGRMLTVDYKDGTKQIFVPANVPVVAFAPGTLADLKPGAKVFIIGKTLGENKVGANRVTFGAGGTTPPM